MNGDRASALVQVPPGVQCFVGDEARRRRAHRGGGVSVFEGWDYEEIIPPLFDYADVFAERRRWRRKTYSFVGRDGSLLALRPDFTSLLAKIAAGRLADRPPPIRLYYSGEVLRYEPPKAGPAERALPDGPRAPRRRRAPRDAEVLAIAARVPGARSARADWVLALGHVGVFDGLARGARPRAAAPARPARARGSEGRARACARRCRAPGAPARPRDALVRLSGAGRRRRRCWTRPRGRCGLARGGGRAWRELRDDRRTRWPRPGLGERVGHRPRRGPRPRLLHRPRLPRLRAAASASRSAAAAATTRCWRASAAAARGRLHARPRPRGAAAGAAGRARRRRQRPPAAARRRRRPRARPCAQARARRARGERRALRRRRGRAMSLTVALSKGKLLAGRRSALPARGPAVPREPRAARWWSTLDGLRFLFVKDMDVPTYVEYGVADCGIAGRDVLLETGSDVYEPLDLGFGRCRLVVARPRGAARRPALASTRARRHQVPAASPPRYFLRARASRSRWCALAGSVELAPGLGLADCIVDVVRDGPHARGERPRGGRGGGGVHRAPHREPRELPRAPRGGGGARGRRCGGAVVRIAALRHRGLAPLPGGAAARRRVRGRRCARAVARIVARRAARRRRARSCAAPRASTACACRPRGIRVRPAEVRAPGAPRADRRSCAGAARHGARASRPSTGASCDARLPAASRRRLACSRRS